MFSNKKNIDEILDIERKQIVLDWLKDYYRDYGVGPVLEYFYFDDGQTYLVEADKYGNYSIIGW